MTMRRRAGRAGLACWLAASLAGCSALTDSILPGKGDAPRQVAEIPKLDASPSAPLKGQPTAEEAATLCLSVAQGLEKQGHHREAALQLELARKHQPKLKLAARIARNWAQAAEQATPAEQAALAARCRSEFQQALREDGTSAALHNDFGHALLRLGDAAEAEQQFRHALALDPKLGHARTNLGLALGQQNRPDEALAEFAKVVSPAEAHCNLAYVYLQAGQPDQAKRQYQLALEKNPGLKAAQDRLAALERLTAKPLPANARLGMPERR